MEKIDTAAKYLPGGTSAYTILFACTKIKIIPLGMLVRGGVNNEYTQKRH